MKGVNCIVVFNKDRDKMLMCKRIKDPYCGLYNFVGGKIEPGEDHLTAAYRELYEETGITDRDLTLTKFLVFEYPLDGIFLEVYAGRLNKDVILRPEIHPLVYMGLDEDFFNMKKFAGEGNIGHIMEHVKMHADELLK
jgi:8-oxo-dGTP diphosphatase